MKRSIGWPMIAALVAASFLLIAGIGMAHYEDDLYRAQQTGDVTEQAQILAASITAAVSFGDEKAAQEYVDALKVNPELQAAGVYNGEGGLFAHFARGGRLPAILLPKTTPREPEIVADTLTVAVPVLEHGKAIGTVAVIASTEPAERRLARYVGLVLLVTMGALIIAILVFSQSAISDRAEQLALVNARLKEEMAERAKTEEALRQSHKMEAVGQLSGGIAHDFNNLIMIVKGNLRLLRKRIGPAANGADQYIDAADEALNRAAHLTQRILAFSRRQPLTPKPVSLSDLVSGMSELIRHSVGERVEIQTRLSARWWVRCDINQMENVILNLAINARDAMPGGGLLVLETADRTLLSAPAGVSDFVPGEYVALSVRDTGEGMSEEVRERAVDPFFTTKPLGKGTGLGLSMTFGYMRQSSGYLTIDSRPGHGTTVTLYVPRTQEDA